METNSPESCSSCAGWRLPLLLVLVLAAIVLMRFLGDRLSPPTAVEESGVNSADATAREHVSLSIDFGNGQRKDFGGLAWREGMTVADLLRSAPDIATTQKGSGQGAFLTAIGGTANEGADGKNWTYEVNGQSADRSFAVFELHAGDRVLWTFGPRR